MTSASSSSKAVLIAGMHRSGTSMVAGLLRQAGVWMGDDLLEAGEGNAFGHFEDKQILEFHRQLLASRRELRPIDFDSGTLRSDPLLFKPLKCEVRRADALLKKLKRPGLWGWKDPRTSLFLKFWLERLEEAFVVVPFRHPLDVYASHLRRANNLDMACLPSLIFQSYVVYNQAILDAASEFPGRFLFVEAPVAADQPSLFLEEVSSLIGVSLNKDPKVVGFVQKDALACETVSKARHAMLQAVFSEVAEIYETLVAEAGPRFARPLVAEEDDKESIAQIHLLLRAAEMVPAAERECLMPLLERWALGMPGETARAKRDLIWSRIQLEISERERIIGEMQSYVVQLEESLKASNERTAASEKQLERQRGYAETLEERAGTLWRERDEALQRVQDQHTQIERQKDYANELEARLRNKDAELKTLTEREGASKQELDRQREYIETLDARAGTLWRERDEALQRVQDQHTQIERQKDYANELEARLRNKDAELKTLTEREDASKQELDRQQEHIETLDARAGTLWRERDEALQRVQDQHTQIERQKDYANELKSCLRNKDAELSAFSEREEVYQEVEEQKLFRFLVRTGLIKDAEGIGRSPG